MEPWGYHLGNLLLHAANAALLFFVARRLLAEGGVAGSLGAASTVVVILGATALVMTELVRTRLGHPSVLLPDAPHLPG